MIPIQRAARSRGDLRGLDQVVVQHLEAPDAGVVNLALSQLAQPAVVQTRGPADGRKLTAPGAQKRERAVKERGGRRIHADSLAICCYADKHPIASLRAHRSRMGSISTAQVLADNLRS